MQAAETAPEGCDLQRAAAVSVDPGQHLPDDPRLILAVPTGPFLDGDSLVRPGGSVVTVDAVQLQPSGLEQARHRGHHAVVLDVPRPALLAREDQHRAAKVPVAHDGAGRAD